MGSASKGKRVASGPIGGKAKHARIGMFLISLYSNPVGQRKLGASASQGLKGGTGQMMRGSSAGRRMRGSSSDARMKRSREIENELMIESPPPSELKDEEEEFYSDDLGDDETRSTSPSKLTARQRAKGNKDLQETLVSLPGMSLSVSR